MYSNWLWFNDLYQQILILSIAILLTQLHFNKPPSLNVPWFFIDLGAL